MTTIHEFSIGASTPARGIDERCRRSLGVNCAPDLPALLVDLDNDKARWRRYRVQISALTTLRIAVFVALLLAVSARR